VNLKNKPRFRNISGIAYTRVINKSLEFLVLWEPGRVSAVEYYKGLEYTAYIAISNNNSTALVYWDPT